jgi:hypothetical protein
MASSDVYFSSSARMSVAHGNLPLWSIRTVRLSFLPTLSSIHEPRSGMIQHEWSLRSPAWTSTEKSTPGERWSCADDDALGPVDDELAAAQHDGDLAEVDLLLDGLLLVQADADLERGSVGQSQLPALVRRVPRTAELVPDVLEGHRPRRSS